MRIRLNAAVILVSWVRTNPLALAQVTNECHQAPCYRLAWLGWLQGSKSSHAGLHSRGRPAPSRTTNPLCNYGVEMAKPLGCQTLLAQTIRNTSNLENGALKDVSLRVRRGVT
jgi:hypothetical protein